MAFGDGTRTLEVFFRNAYIDFIRINAQQMQSAASDTVDQERLSGEHIFFDGYDPLIVTATPATDDIVERDTALQANTPKETSRIRTGLPPRHWEFTELFDPRESLRTMRALRPDSQYARNVIAGFNRRKDRLIIESMDGNRLDGDLASVTFATDGGTIIASDIEGGIAYTPLTFSKIIEGRLTLESNGVQRGVPWTVLAHPDQLYKLLKFSERITNFDFHTARALVSGELDQFLGLRFRMTTEIDEETLDTQAGRKTYMYAQDAAILGMNADVEVNFDIVFQQGHSLQVAHYLDAAATRMFGKKIVVINGTTADNESNLSAQDI